MSFPSPAGCHDFMTAPLGMYTKPSRRTGFAAVLASAVAAGTIASSSGNARLTPMPRRNVRRGNAILLMNMTVSLLDPISTSLGRNEASRPRSAPNRILHYSASATTPD